MTIGNLNEESKVIKRKLKGNPNRIEKELE